MGVIERVNYMTKEQLRTNQNYKFCYWYSQVINKLKCKGHAREYRPCAVVNKRLLTQLLSCRRFTQPNTKKTLASNSNLIGWF